MYCETEAPQGGGTSPIFHKEEKLCAVSITVTAAAGSSFSFSCSLAAATTLRTTAAVAVTTTAADAAATKSDPISRFKARNSNFS